MAVRKAIMLNLSQQLEDEPASEHISKLFFGKVVCWLELKPCSEREGLWAENKCRVKTRTGRSKVRKLDEPNCIYFSL